MSDKLKKADVLAEAVREYLQPYLVKLNAGEKINKTRLRIAVSEALAAYEAAPAESQAAGEEEQRAKDSAHFHAWYLSGTAKPPKYPDPEYIWHAAMNQGRKQSAEQLAAAQARIAFLEGQNEKLAAMYRRDVENVAVSVDVNDSLRARVAVLEKALEGAKRDSDRLHWLHQGGEKDLEGFEWGVFRVKWSKHGKPEEVWQTFSDFSDLDAEMARERAAQSSREKEAE